MEQTPLRQALEFSTSSDGRYVFEFTPSITYGIITAGGLVMSAIHKVATDFVTTDARTKFHTDVLNLNLQYFRPTFPAPHKSVIEVELVNVSQLATTLHIRLSQKKLCLAGHVTLTNLSFPGVVTTRKEWRLLPAPSPTSVQSLESDKDPNWVAYRRPYTAGNRANAQSYLIFHVPKEESVTYRNDQWVTPGWTDKQLPNGAVWTNEMVHFVVDNGIPLLYDVMSETGERRVHDQIVRAGLEQRKARDEGRSDQFDGEGLGDAEIMPYSLATLSVSTEIKKLLPQTGVKWLFMRASTTGIYNSRMDHDITILDQYGDIVASSHHVVLVIPLTAKDTKL